LRAQENYASVTGYFQIFLKKGMHYNYGPFYGKRCILGIKK
jgi:hypothetical protein